MVLKSFKTMLITLKLSVKLPVGSSMEGRIRNLTVNPYFGHLCVNSFYVEGHFRSVPCHSAVGLGIFMLKYRCY